MTEGLVLALAVLIGAVAGALPMALGVWLERRHDRIGHDDRDYACIFWHGDGPRSPKARCLICNPL